MSVNKSFEDFDLDDWVAYAQTVHAREIDLSLDRVNEVYQRVLPTGLSAFIISIAGTNGKGSCAEMLSSCYRASGYSVGKYTSPHLLRFNERVQIDGVNATDDDICRAFTVIEYAREDIPLTYFEFATLVAIYCFSRANVDVAVMEVGLGGRLDAVNILECDAALITSISIDHTAWLGNTIAKIAKEKSGIVRQGKPVVIASNNNTVELTTECNRRGAKVIKLADDYSYQASQGQAMWAWSSADQEIKALPLPFGLAGVQVQNAAGVLATIYSILDKLPIEEQSVKSGLSNASLYARQQVVMRQPRVILDVAHNEDSLRQLAVYLSENAANKRVLAVCSMLKDKEIKTSLEQVAPLINSWFIATLHNERGADKEELISIVEQFMSTSPKQTVARPSDIDISGFDNVNLAYDAAFSSADKDDIIVVFGSFYVVADILARFTGSEH